MKMEITGATLRQLLEHGVARSGVDAEPGRFPQVSGLTFRFTTSRPEGSRVLQVMVGNKPLEEGKLYRSRLQISSPLWVVMATSCLKTCAH